MRRRNVHATIVRFVEAAASRHGLDVPLSRGFLATGSIALSVALGMALGAAQVGWEFARGKPIDVMQWMSLFLVLASGTAALITANPRFVMLKPTIIYCVVGVVMLRRGWMNRYLPPAAVQWVPDIAIIFGYAWPGSCSSRRP
jgi:intracellular septation protein